MTLGSFGKLPWVEERDIWRGLPKTARIPTGGWRGWGAVPSHSYPYESTLPNGYWQGLGMCASVALPAAQRAKTFTGFGVTTAPTAPTTAADYRLLAARARDAVPPRLTEAALYEAKAAELEKAASPWTTAFTAIMQTGAQAYTAQQTYNIQRELIRAGVPLQQQTPQQTPPPANGAPGGISPLVWLALIGGVGLVLAMR